MINNFRDLAYLGRIKECHLFRSASLDLASKDDILLLKEKYRITSIIDLRNSVEIFEKADCLYDELAYYKCSLQEKCDEYIAQDEESIKKRKAYFESLDKKCQDDEFAKRHMCEFYESLPKSETFINSFKYFLELLFEKQPGILWHCSLGRDRAGMMTALLLTILGFDEEIIIQDYLFSNNFSRKNDNRAYDLADESYLRAFFKAMGDKQEYFKLLDLDLEKINFLKEKYLRK